MSGHANDKRNKTTHSSFAKYSKMYKIMELILLPSLIDNYPHSDISNQISWEKKYTSSLFGQFVRLGLVDKIKKRTTMAIAPINELEKYARQI